MSDQPQRLQHLWNDQAGTAALFFNIWGEMFKAEPKVLTMKEIGKIMPRYGAVEIFGQGDPEGFLDYFGGKNKLMSPDVIESSTLLFQPGFPPEYTKMRREQGQESESYLSFLSLWLFLVFYAYSYFNPKNMGPDAVWKCLLLSHNSYYVYQDFWLCLVNWCSYGPNYQRTRKANLSKRRWHIEIAEMVNMAAKAKAAAKSRFAGKSMSQQADLLEPTIKGADGSPSHRTIRRILSELKKERLAKRTSGQKSE